MGKKCCRQGAHTFRFRLTSIASSVFSMLVQHLMYDHNRLTIWLFNKAMENDPFIDDFPIETSMYNGFSMSMLVITRGYRLSLRHSETSNHPETSNPWGTLPTWDPRHQPDKLTEMSSTRRLQHGWLHQHFKTHFLWLSMAYEVIISHNDANGSPFLIHTTQSSSIRAVLGNPPLPKHNSHSVRLGSTEKPDASDIINISQHLCFGVAQYPGTKLLKFPSQCQNIKYQTLLFHTVPLWLYRPAFFVEDLSQLLSRLPLSIQPPPPP